MGAGRYDRRIVVERKTEARDALGGVTESWSALCAVWARYLPGPGSERFASEAIRAETTARFETRWRADLTRRDRILFDGVAYDIVDIQEIGRRRGLMVSAKALL